MMADPTNWNYEFQTQTSFYNNNVTDNALNHTPLIPTSNALSECSRSTKFFLNSVFAGSLCALGFVGNTVSFIVLARDRGTPIASFLLRALAFVDNFFLCSWFVHFSLNDLFTYLDITGSFHTTWLYIRVYTYPLLFIGQTGTVWLTVLIAASRYIAVCKPYNAPRYCSLNMLQKAVLMVFSFAITYNLPRFFEVKIMKHPINGTFSYNLARTGVGLSKIYGLLYFDVLYYISSFVLPLILLIFLNTHLTVAYRLLRRRRSTMRLRQNSASCRDHNITLVMIVVIFVFILCNAPAKFVQILWGYKIQQCLALEFVFIELSNVLEVLNSSVNFIIYCVFRNHFRNLLHQRFFAAQTRRSSAFLTTGLVSTTVPLCNQEVNMLDRDETQL